MKNYRLYELTDFVMDDDFIGWVQENKEWQNQFWKRFLDENPDKHLIIAEAKRIVEMMPRINDTLSDDDVAVEAERLLKTIGQPAEEPAVPLKRVIFPTSWYYAAAAILLVTAAGLFLSIPKGNVNKPFTYASLTLTRQLAEKVNLSNKPVAVSLPDGSTIELGANSRISYSNRLDSLQTRDIYLSGEAFFKVTKDANRPFRVFANEIVTKVLGTSFSVSSYDADSTIRITVRTGKVSVYDQQNSDTSTISTPYNLGGLIVTPNQQLVYVRNRQKFQKILLDNPVSIRTTYDKANLVYEEAPLEKVFNDLGKAYGINIVFDEEVVEKCTVSADLNNESFYQKLDLICKAVGAQYKVADGQIVIDTEGCK